MITHRRLLAVVLVVAFIAAACSGGAGHRAAGGSESSAVVSPSTLVDPFMGTGVGGTAVGHIDDSPAADLPFGMIQWGPDTAPHRADGGGYSSGDTAISGFSLTHLNGPGCAGLGDVPILPTVGAIAGSPETTTDRFTHESERAAPGRYAVRLTDPGVDVALAVTTRSGIGRFVFPPTASANLLVKVADSAVPAQRAHAVVVGDREIDGWVESGQFCDAIGTYRLAFVARFDRPFTRVATWRGTASQPGARSVDGPHTGIAITFDTRSSRTVGMSVGVSFVSIAGARANLAAELHGRGLGAVERAGTARWDAMLGHIAIAGGRAADRRTFYSAFYRSLLHPNVFSDDDGRYPGMDGRVHVARGWTQYTNFSEWDVYRSQIPLVALVAPDTVGQMVHSLLADYEQIGRLPKWAYTDVETGEMNGDAADPIIAEAYAFGARNFDANEALQAMVRGATTVGTGLGWDVERQDLDEYLARGWVQVDRRDRTSFDYTIGGSETLEYAIDDSAIATFASAIGDAHTAATFRARAGNWRHLFNPATGYLAARDADGRFPNGPAFQGSPLPGIGQDGWEEGNSIQYTWSVPQDLRGLFDAMGGNAVAVRKLDSFFRELNTSRKQPYDWAGNEPAFGIPWEYDFAGAPWRTQDVVRQIATTLYSATPDGEPGNDDLGALASWYVWAAIGMYPETPGRADLVLSTPMFPSITIRRGSAPPIAISAPRAPADRYVTTLALRGMRAPAPCAGRSYSCAWLPASVLQTGAQLDFTLGSTPNRQWGAAPAAAPRSLTPPRAASGS
ncbi:MAG TPA: GH92 family glycosyl hydrolase [Acidimicrobiia bacterium]|nr:GH92 family glycosyl hydrolase [Acidimicrobiia bacterium]